MTKRRDDEAERRASMTRDPYRHMPQQVPFKREFAWGAFFFFAWVLIGSIAMMLVSHAKPFDGRSDLFLLVAGAMLLGVLGAVLQLVRLGSYPKEERPVGFALAGLALPIGLFLAWAGAWMVHTAAYVPSYMGRRHRKGKRLLAPETQAGADWVGAPATELALAIPDEERAALGAEWRNNGKKEHASVAAFAQLTLDLMAVGAPPALVAAAQSDALDEVRHAAACFAIARDVDGLVESPLPFPDARARRFLFTASRSIALTQIAIDALADGVLNEGIAARLLAQLAKTCAVPALSSILREMAADESRHAAHSWEIVAWCVESGGATVAKALRGAVSGMPEKVCSALPAGARDGAWERWGVHGAAMEAAAFARTREAARAKLLTLLDDYAAGRLRRAATIPLATSAPMATAAASGTSAAHASQVYVR